MAVGSSVTDTSTVQLGGNVNRLVDLFALDTTTVTVVANDILVKVAVGYSVWDGIVAGRLVVAMFDESLTASGGDATKKIQAITAGRVDASLLRIEGSLSALTEAQLNQLSDYGGINALDVNNETFAGDSTPTEV